MSNKRSFLLLLFIFVVGAFGLGMWKSWPRDEAIVVFCNVGQGDGILIQKGMTQVIIDGGPSNKILECLKKHIPLTDHTIELVVSTHPDADHLTGLISVLEEYQVQQIWIEPRATKTQTFFLFRQKLLESEEKGMIVTTPKLMDNFQLAPQIFLTTLFPFQGMEDKTVFARETTETQLSAIAAEQSKRFGATNDGCIATKLTIGEVTFLFTGDLESEQEIALIEKGVLTHINVLKAGHHGSKTSNLLPFLKEVQPETVIISVGKNNRYGHPHNEALKNFKEVGAHLYRTDKNGEVEVVSNGHNYWVTSEL
jgi:competence protein ComEC